MWKDYSKAFIKNNRTSSISIAVAAFIAALFLSLICTLYYNFWIYDIEQITLEEGDWQGRITGDFPEEALMAVENTENIKDIKINRGLSEGRQLTADVRLQNMRSIYRDMPLIAETLGLEEDNVSYHETLLSRYLIHDPCDSSPPLLLTFYLFILVIVAVSLILIIHNSFAVSMNARIQQFGIFSSIGATPGQIFTCLMQEAAVLCVLPILLGNVIGIAGSLGVICLTNLIAADIPQRHEAVFQYHPCIFAAAVLVSAITVFVSAAIPAGKLSRLTPLQAVRNPGEFCLKKKKRSAAPALLFGIEGELAGNALKAQRKALRTSSLSLTLSFLGFTVMMCFFTLTGISTNHTYFERYQDAWDIMVTLKDTDITEWKQGEVIETLPEIRSSAAYQKASAFCTIEKSDLSPELSAIGGLPAVAGSAVTEASGQYFIKAPLIIMDDSGFQEYCRQLNLDPATNGTIVLNRIWDSINSNFRYKEYLPLVKGTRNTISLYHTQNPDSSAEIPVLGYTQTPPILREEYENYTLVQFIPSSLWTEISGKISNTEPDTYLRILGQKDAALSELNELQMKISDIILPFHQAETENRIQEKISDQTLRKGFMVILGGFCALLAIIGIANVFSNTLGFVRQRKQEFARYMSIGMTPESMKKMFCIEALIIAGRPILITLPLTAVLVAFMITASYLDPAEFLTQAPLLPIFLFISVIFLFVGLAYYIGAKRVLTSSLKDSLTGLDR